MAGSPNFPWEPENPPSPNSGPHTACWLYRMDVPKAPKLLGALVGHGVAENAVPVGKLADLYGKVEDTETRRQGVAEVLLYVKVCVLPSSLEHPWSCTTWQCSVQLPCLVTQ